MEKYLPMCGQGHSSTNHFQTFKNVPFSWIFLTFSRGKLDFTKFDKSLF